uniref:Resolvase HTH domain-containing protein n=1 Tax=Lepeophtheirus salmonis TaxID=72036 RepID=A0A0K2UF04_LEPSM
MEQARRDAILELARAGHKPSAIYKLLNYPKTTVYRIFSAWEVEGKVCCKAHNMTSDRIRTPRLLEGLWKSIKASPGTSLSRLAKNHGVSKQLVYEAVNDDLGYRSYRMAKKHILTTSMKATRLTNGKRLLNT